MSWKSLVTASLLCVLASPAFAVPKLEITSGGLEPTTGNWIWNVRIAPTTATTPVATELGFTANTALKTVVNASPSSWDTNTPGNAIFTWEVPYNTPPKPEGIEANCPTGTCSITNAANLPATTGHNATLVNGTLNQVFAALGSAPALTLSSPAGTTIGASVPYLTITTKGPSSTSLTGTMTLSGSYAGSGHVAEISSGTNPTNYKGFTGVATRSVIGGDINLDGSVNFSDVLIMSPNYNHAVTNGWAGADLTGDGTVNFSDVLVMSPNYNHTGGTNTPLTATGVLDTPGAGAGLGSSAVPEPASIALLGLALLGGMGLVGRKR